MEVGGKFGDHSDEFGWIEEDSSSLRCEVRGEVLGRGVACELHDNSAVEVDIDAHSMIVKCLNIAQVEYYIGRQARCRRDIARRSVTCFDLDEFSNRIRRCQGKSWHVSRSSSKAAAHWSSVLRVLSVSRNTPRIGIVEKVEAGHVIRPFGSSYSEYAVSVSIGAVASRERTHIKAGLRSNGNAAV